MGSLKNVSQFGPAVRPAVNIKKYIYTSLGTQRCLDYSYLLPPFTRTWTILPGKKMFAIKVDLLDLESQNQA